MAHSITFWRRLSFGLACFFLVALFRIHMLTGYPKEWKRIQTGMSISEARAICGPPTYSPGMKPDTWEVPLLWGGWVLAVGHDEFSQGPDALVGTIEVYFDYNIAGAKLWLRQDRPIAPKDYASYYKAYGRVLKAE